MNPRFETLTERKLMGKRMMMSFSHNKTGELWHSFMIQRKEIQNTLTSDLFSMQIFEQPVDFRHPDQKFEKWAAVEVADFDTIPEGMETYVLKGGLYTVFPYKGSSADYFNFPVYFRNLLPGSTYLLDNGRILKS